MAKGRRRKNMKAATATLDVKAKLAEYDAWHDEINRVPVARQSDYRWWSPDDWWDGNRLQGRRLS